MTRPRITFWLNQFHEHMEYTRNIWKYLIMSLISGNSAESFSWLKRQAGEGWRRRYFTVSTEGEADGIGASWAAQDRKVNLERVRWIDLVREGYAWCGREPRDPSLTWCHQGDSALWGEFANSSSAPGWASVQHPHSTLPAQWWWW